MKSSKIVMMFAILAMVSGKAQKKIKSQKNPRPFLVEDEDCLSDPNTIGPMEGFCDWYWACDDFGRIERQCPLGQIFDSWDLVCDFPGNAECAWDDDNNNVPEVPDNNEECPMDTDEIIFIPGDYCDEYYICINGQPRLFECRFGTHWNKKEQFCDEAHLAGCDPTASPPGSSLPDCNSTFVGTMPHPTNCNWFWYCDRGNRSLQQCQHLFHYDYVRNTCVVMSQARCVTAMKRT